MSIPFWSGEIGGVIDKDSLTAWNTFRVDLQLFPSADAPFLIKSMPMGEVGFEIDRRTRKNRSGQKKTATGAKSPKWSISFIWWTPEQHRAWQAILPQINPKLAANQIKTRSVYHPFLDDYEITQAIIYKMAMPQIQDNLIAEVTLYFEEVGAPDKDVKKALKTTTNPNDSSVAIDKDFVSDDAPPPPP